MAFTISWHLPLQALPGPGEEASWCSVRCSLLYNMYHEGSSPGSGRAWGGAFMAFIFSERYVWPRC